MEGEKARRERSMVGMEENKVGRNGRIKAGKEIRLGEKV